MNLVKKFFCGVILAALIPGLFGGTLIYKIGENEEKIVSDITILSINNKQVVLKVGNGIERIPLSALIKYYSTDIKIGSAFDDGSQEYDVQVRNIKKPASRTGYSGSKKNRTTSELEVEYDIRLKNNVKNKKRSIKTPHFYLYLLTMDKSNKRKIFIFHYPDQAKCNFKNYDEALMMEKAFSSERESIYLDYGNNKNNALSWQTQKFVLDGIKERRIIASYLIIWGKDRIVYEGGEIWDQMESISPDWFTRPDHF